MKTKAISVLGLSLALLAKPCCVIPLLISLFGLGSMSLVSTLYPMRWIILASAALSFSVSAFFTFREGVSVVTRVVWVASCAAAVWFWLHM